MLNLLFHEIFSILSPSLLEIFIEFGISIVRAKVFPLFQIVFGTLSSSLPFWSKSLYLALHDLITSKIN